MKYVAVVRHQSRWGQNYGKFFEEMGPAIKWKEQLLSEGTRKVELIDLLKYRPHQGKTE